MKTFYVAVADGASETHANGGRFMGGMRYIDVEAENRVQAFLKMYHILSEDHSDITALKNSGQDYMLGFTADEWEEIAQQPIRLKVVEVQGGDAQIQDIRETPFL
jgi:hypothetical protein